MRTAGFSAFIIVLLFAELFAPLVWADRMHPPDANALAFADPVAPGTSSGATSTAPTGAATTPSTTSPAASTPGTTASSSSATTASVGGKCDIRSMSDAERRQLHDFLFSPTGAFRGDFLNDLSELDALAQAGEKPTDPFSKERKKQDGPNEDNTVDVRDVAKLQGLAGKSEEEIAKKFGKWDYEKKKIKDDTRISIAEAKKFLAQEPKDSPYQEVLGQIQELLKEKTDSKAKEEKEKEDTKQLEPYERYKVVLPGEGKEVSLADVFRAQKIDPDSCLLKGEVINGRVGYIAILDTDITYGTKNAQLIKGDYVSPATGKATPELTSQRGGETVNQRIYGSSVVGYLNLNGGANLIVPEFYRDWIVFSYTYTKWDFYGSLLGSIAAFGAIKNLEEVKKVKEASLNHIKTRDPDKLLANRIRESIIGEFERDAAGRIVMKKNLSVPAVPAAGGMPALPGGSARTFEIDSTTNTLRYYDAGGVEVSRVNGVSNIDEAIAKQPDLDFNTVGGLQKELKEADYNLNSLRQAKGTLDARIATSFMLAGGWLGPARMAFSLNNGILFQARHQKDDKFLRVLANKKVLADFKQASGFLAIGKIQELAAKYAGMGFVPEKAFYAKNILLLNYPEAQKTPNYESTTQLLSKDDGSIAVFTRWRGPSYTLNYEDMRTFANKQSPESFTSIDLVSNNIIAEPSLEEKNLRSLTGLFSLAVPWLVSRKLLELGERQLGAGVFLTTLEFLEINENVGKDLACDRDEYEEFKNKYRVAFVGGLTISALSVIRATFEPLRDFLRGTSFWSATAAGGLNLLDWTNPPEAWRFYIGNQAIAYTSNCKDQMNTILTWQPVPERVSKASNTLAEKLPAINDQLSKIGLGKAIGANEEDRKAEAEIKNLKDVLNLRAVTQDQGGVVLTPELLYIHVDQSTSSIKGDLYGLVRDSCGLQDGIQSADGRRLTLGDGLEASINGTKVLSFQSDIWKLRAMARNKIQSLGRVIIPNTIIQSHLRGGTDTFLDIAPTGQSVLVSPPCDLAGAIFELTGRQIGNDFTAAIGKVRTLQTSEGDASLMDGQIDFVGRNGIGASVPTPDELRKSIHTGGRLNIRNNGQVTLYGTGGSSSQPIGNLVSIIGENGALHYDAATQQISVIIYSIFETSAQNIQGVSIDSRGKGVEIQVQPKRGLEDSANKLNAALDKIAGTDGITSFETKDHIYYITPDGKLRVIDKNTGKATDYTITGAISKDGEGNLIIPTDKGPFKINLSNDNGQPTLKAEGPDGLSEALALLAARGQNGMLTFNPSTGAINVYNGQDIPLNPAFATQGIGYSGNADGSSQGVPAESPFLKPSSGSGSTTQNGPPKLFLPSVPNQPDQWPLAAMLAGVVLIGIVAIRFRQDE